MSKYFFNFINFYITTAKVKKIPGVCTTLCVWCACVCLYTTVITTILHIIIMIVSVLQTYNMKKVHSA